MDPKALRERVYGYLSLTYYRTTRLTDEEFREACQALDSLAALAPGSSERRHNGDCDQHGCLGVVRHRLASGTAELPCPCWCHESSDPS